MNNDHDQDRTHSHKTKLKQQHHTAQNRHHRDDTSCLTHRLADGLLGIWRAYFFDDIYQRIPTKRLTIGVAMVTSARRGGVFAILAIGDDGADDW